MKKTILQFASGIALISWTLIAQADELNLRPGVTDISRQVYDLHMLIFGICVWQSALWSLAYYSGRSMLTVSQGVKKPRNFITARNSKIAWTIVPTIILVLMAIPSTQVLIAMYDTGGEDMTVEVRGYQWKWQYKYLDEDYNRTFSFFSNLATPRSQINNRQVKTDTYLLEVDRPLKIPANRKVRFLITAEDVIHAWWVPDFGIKRDAVPGVVE